MKPLPRLPLLLALVLALPLPGLEGQESSSPSPLTLAARIGGGGHGYTPAPVSGARESGSHSMDGDLRPAARVGDPSEHGEDPGAETEIFFGGFADIGVYSLDDLRSTDMQLGQFVLHTMALMPGNFSLFAEVSLNSLPSWETRVERLLISWEQSDALKLSAGRHHIPVTWWNATFHHGPWLQSSARRPMMIGFSDAFVPNHAVGVTAEGLVPGTAAIGLRYHATLSGGGDDLRRSSGAKDPLRQATTLALGLEPRAIPRFRVGAVVYLDPDRVRSGIRVAETLSGFHLVHTGERPEFLAEYIRVHHEIDGGQTFLSHGAYGQIAWRLSGAAEILKPYLRVERMRIDREDPSLANTRSQDLATLGVRVDLTPQLALKLEGARRRMPGMSGTTELIAQVSTTW